jgi:hypothetical protein
MESYQCRPKKRITIRTQNSYHLRRKAEINKQGMNSKVLTELTAGGVPEIIASDNQMTPLRSKGLIIN